MLLFEVPILDPRLSYGLKDEFTFLNGEGGISRQLHC